ncbi:hypothetical protein HAV_00172 [Candidatus Hepatincola sp. Av]
MKLLVLFFSLITTIYLPTILKAEDIKTYNIEASVNQFVIVNFEKAIVGTVIAQNRYGHMQVNKLSNKAIVILLNKNNDDNDAILKAFNGKILLSDNQCNKYLFNITISEKTKETKPQNMFINSLANSKAVCEPVNKNEEPLYQRTMMLK